MRRLAPDGFIAYLSAPTAAWLNVLLLLILLAPLVLATAHAAPTAPGRPAAVCGIFVATMGVDDAGCGLSPETPCRTINHGIARAAIEGQGCVFVQAGAYQEILTLQSGINVIGGFDVDWLAADYSDLGHEVIVTGGLDSGTSQYMAIHAADLYGTTLVSELIVQPPNAVGTVNGNGRSSYGVYVSNSAGLTLQHLRITAGNGANGAAGADGLDAPSLVAVTGMVGNPGGAAEQYVALCDATSCGLGGARGVNPGDAGSWTRGGAGGPGGTMDTSCGIFGCSNCTATSGALGFDAAVVYYPYGSGGYGGAGASTCGSGGAGYDGRVGNGTGGAGGVTGILFAGGFAYARAGQSGTLGSHGTGGGGGGGSGGCDVGTDSYGAGGGGGGAGGLAARGAGAGGGGGGGSFGVFAVNSSLAVNDVTFIRGTGGHGGNGGNGGAGQAGGVGGLGGPGAGGAQAGGTGGDGAHGGHGGGGGGGAGGSSWGLVWCSSTVSATNFTVQGGAPGTGGAGGASAPAAPPALRDGDPGDAGVSGTIDTSGPVGCPAPPEAMSTLGTTATAATCDPAPCTLVGVPEAEAPRELRFAGASPNPMRTLTRLRFALPAVASVSLEVFDLHGARGRLLADRAFGAGEHVVEWDGRLDSGERARAGIYWVVLRTGGRTISRRVAVLQ